jgi:adenosylmethionine-8-amino-7-oxononanoate aminotransferase
LKKTSFIVSLDREHVWHPFTPFSTWLDENYEPTIVTEGKGCTLQDSNGRRYLDGNSSIWVNIHGHRNTKIDRAIRNQLRKIAHSSFLGLTNELAPVLAKKLTKFCCPNNQNTKEYPSRVFFSDDGSTAIETAIKIVIQYFALTDNSHRYKFVSLGKGYHGDTVGAMSVSHSDSFHGFYKKLQFPSTEAMMPYCYRCPYNRAKPSKQEARQSKKCNFECVDEFQKSVHSCGSSFAGTVIEPIVQGAGGMVMHPPGYLSAVSNITQKSGGKVIFDEVMTGFYRSGAPMAFHAEDCSPDIIALAKGLTAGYLPLAATLVKEELVAPFIGGPEKTLYHGHSYSGNQLGCAAALANLEILSTPNFSNSLKKKIHYLDTLSQVFWNNPNVGDVRQTGLILAIEIVENRETRKLFSPDLRIGWRISEAAKDLGLLTRPIGDVLLIMPPLSISKKQLFQCVDMLNKTIHKFFCKIDT